MNGRAESEVGALTVVFLENIILHGVGGRPAKGMVPELAQQLKVPVSHLFSEVHKLFRSAGRSSKPGASKAGPKSDVHGARAATNGHGGGSGSNSNSARRLEGANSSRSLRQHGSRRTLAKKSSKSMRSQRSMKARGSERTMKHKSQAAV